MATKRNKPGIGATPSPQGNVSSSAEARNWTPEEMAEAQPLPLPTTPPVSSITHSATLPTGPGRTSPAGPPEEF